MQTQITKGDTMIYLPQNKAMHYFTVIMVDIEL